MPDLPPILETRLREAHAQLLEKGELLSPQEIQAARKSFLDHFGPAALNSVEGPELLELMHGRGERRGMAYWLEFKNDSEFPGRKFGSISGGSAHKFGIFRRRGTDQWVDAGNRDISQQRAIELAMSQRSQLEICLKFFETFLVDAPEEDGFWLRFQNSIREIAPDIYRSGWAHKYFCILHPDFLDDYHRHSWQRHHLLKLLIAPPEHEGLYVLVGRFASLARHFGWPLIHLTEVLNEASGPPCRYWRVGTNIEDVDAWPAMRDGGYAAIGWSQLGDLSEAMKAPDRRELIKKWLPESGYYHSESQLSTRTRKAGEIANFVGVIATNDIIVASHGQQIRGLGRVTGPYYYDPSPPEEAPNRRPVNWLRAAQEELFQTKQGLLTSVYELKDEALILELERAILLGGPLPFDFRLADEAGDETDEAEEVSELESPPGPAAGGGTRPPISPGTLPGESPSAGEPPAASPTITSQFRKTYLHRGHAEQPTSEDHLGTTPYARGLAAFISTPRTQTPFTISIEGPWGMGKTSFLKIVSAELKRTAASAGKSDSIFHRLKQKPPPLLGQSKEPSAPSKKKGSHFRRLILKVRWLKRSRPKLSPKVIWFNPWRHDAGESLWAAFLYEFADQTEKSLPWPSRQMARARFVCDALRDKWLSWLISTSLFAIAAVGISLVISRIKSEEDWDGTFDKSLKIFGAAFTISWLIPAVKAVIEYVKGLRRDAEKIWKKDDEKERVCAAEKASERFRKFLASYLGRRERIYVVLDDLDRCAAPKAAELLDSLQLLISGNGEEGSRFPVVFLLALDREKVAAGVAVKYKEVLPFVGEGLSEDSDKRVQAGRDFGYEYLQKFIDVPFRLPNPGTVEINKYISYLAKETHPGHHTLTPAGTPPPSVSNLPTGDQEDGTGAGGPIGGDDGAKATTSGTVQALTNEIFLNLDLVSAMRTAAPMLGNNPRRMKQYLNLLRLRASLAVATELFSRHSDIHISDLAKIVALELARPVLYRRLCEESNLRTELAHAMATVVPNAAVFFDPPEKIMGQLSKDFDQNDRNWLASHAEALISPIDQDGIGGFPSAHTLEIILHISPPAAKAEARAAEEALTPASS